MNTPSLNDVGDAVKIISKVRDDFDNLKILFTVLFLIFLYSYFFYSIDSIKWIFKISTLGSATYYSLTNFGFSPKLSEHLLTLLILIIITIVSLSVLLIKDFFWKRRPYKWDYKKGLFGWDFHGSVVIEREDGVPVIKIKLAELGAVVEGRSWRNSTMKFEFKIPSSISYGQGPQKSQLERGFGIIFRAKNLGQYYMLKIDQNGYHPHVRNMGFWENNGPTVTSSKLNDSYLNHWIKAKLVMKNDLLSVLIGEDSFEFCIPTHSVVSRDFPENYEGSISDQPLLRYTELPYRNTGTVGFRSAAFEEVYIRKLEVKPGHWRDEIMFWIKSLFL